MIEEFFAAKINLMPFTPSLIVGNEGVLIILSNGATLKIDNNLIIIEQSNNTIILNSKDANEIVAFLEN